MTSVGCPEDLLVVARRHPLDPDARAILARHLEGCSLCRMSVDIGRSTGVLPAPDEADRALAARLVGVALSPRWRATPMATPVTALRVRRRRARRLFTVIAAGLLMAGTASAAWWQYARRSPVAPRVPVAQAPAARPRLPRPAPAPAAPLDPVLPPAPVVAPAPAPQRPKPARIAMRASSEPSDLFAAANRARGAGELDRAIGLYQALQATFPASPEAKVSRLSLAELHLRRNRPERALALYDAYLGSDDQTLAIEAIIGKAQALARLGRADEERAVWQRLRDHGAPEYRWRAERRLRELAPAPVSP